MPLPAGFNLAGAFAGSFLVVVVTRSVALPPRIDLAPVSLVVPLCSIDATWPAAWGVASLGWLFLQRLRHGPLRRAALRWFH